MSMKERRALLGAYLETLSGVPSIDYPDSEFRPPDDGGIHLRVRYIVAAPDRLTHSAGHIERFEMQISVVAPADRTHGGDKAIGSDDWAELIQDHFVSDTAFAGTGEKTRVRQKPAIWQGYTDPKNGSRIIPVSIYLETLPA